MPVLAGICNILGSPEILELLLHYCRLLHGPSWANYLLIQVVLDQNLPRDIVLVNLGISHRLAIRHRTITRRQTTSRRPLHLTGVIRFRLIIRRIIKLVGHLILALQHQQHLPRLLLWLGRTPTSTQGVPIMMGGLPIT